MNDALRKAVAVAASSLGLAGFVAVLGGAVVYVRFLAAGVPPEQAVDVVPNGQLAVFGAVSLALFLGLGLAAVGLVYLLDRRGRPTRRTLLGLLAVVAAEMAYVIWISTPDGSLVGLKVSPPWAFKSGLTILLMVAVAAGGYLLRGRASGVTVPKDKGIPLNIVGVEPRSRRQALAILFGVELAFALAVAVVDAWLAAALLVAALLGAVMLRIADVTEERFAVFGLSLFASVIAFGAIATSLRAVFDPVAQPVAVLRTDDPTGVCGLYVGETPERVYLARVEEEGRSGRLFWVPRSEVVSSSVGSLEDRSRAAGRAPEPRDELLAARGPGSLPETAPVDVEITKEHTRKGRKDSRKEGTKRRPTGRAPAPGLCDVRPPDREGEGR